MTFDEKIDKFRKRLIARAFKDGGNITQAAKLLGMNRTTLTMKLKAMRLKAENFVKPPEPPTAEGNTDYTNW